MFALKEMSEKSTTETITNDKDVASFGSKSSSIEQGDEKVVMPEKDDKVVITNDESTKKKDEELLAQLEQRVNDYEKQMIRDYDGKLSNVYEAAIGPYQHDGSLLTLYPITISLILVLHLVCFRRWRNHHHHRRNNNSQHRQQEQQDLSNFHQLWIEGKWYKVLLSCISYPSQDWKGSLTMIYHCYVLWRCRALEEEFSTPESYCTYGRRIVVWICIGLCIELLLTGVILHQFRFSSQYRHHYLHRHHVGTSLTSTMIILLYVYHKTFPNIPISVFPILLPAQFFSIENSFFQPDMSILCSMWIIAYLSSISLKRPNLQTFLIGFLTIFLHEIGFISYLCKPYWNNILLGWIIFVVLLSYKASSSNHDDQLWWFPCLEHVSWYNDQRQRDEQSLPTIILSSSDDNNHNRNSHDTHRQNQTTTMQSMANVTTQELDQIESQQQSSLPTTMGSITNAMTSINDAITSGTVVQRRGL